MVNCKEAIHNLYQYLDRELSPEELQVVKVHLDRCPPCRELFEFEANVLTLVGSRCRETVAPPELLDRVRKLVQS
jgi:mycothiol system anti-sigma-R factor